MAQALAIRAQYSNPAKPYVIEVHAAHTRCQVDLQVELMGTRLSYSGWTCHHLSAPAS